MRRILQNNPRHSLHRKLAMILPLPFGRGEGRGEGSRRVVYPTVPSVTALAPPTFLTDSHKPHSCPVASRTPVYRVGRRYFERDVATCLSSLPTRHRTVNWTACRPRDSKRPWAIPEIGAHCRSKCCGSLVPGAFRRRGSLHFRHHARADCKAHAESIRGADKT